MKKLTIVATLLIGVALFAQGQEQKANLATCPSGWTAGPDADWKIFWNDALAEARQTGKKIFVLSTGSDWCGWCMKLKKEVLTTETFKDFAKKNLVLLYLDSPRKPLPEAQTLHNRTISRELGLSGGVPCAAVFAADARRLGVLSGGGYTASNYVERLEKILTEKGELPKSGQVPSIFVKGYSEPEADIVENDSQEELKKLAASIRAKKPAEAEKELRAAEEGAAAENRRGKLDAEKKAKNGNPAIREVVINDVKWTYEIVDSGVVLGNAGGIWDWVKAVSNCTVEVLSIPETIDGKPVRGIGSGAFERCTRLTSLKLPSSLRSIGFAAFEDCRGLTSLTIPSGVTNIASRAFRNCTKLKSVEIPSSVKNIDDLAFSGCDELLTVSVEKDNASYCSVDGIMYDKSMTIVQCCPGGRTGKVTIPDGVRSIGDYAFERCRGLTSVEIPSSVKRIGQCAFLQCSGLTSMSIPASVTDMAECYGGAFRFCDNLKSFTVDPANLAYSSRNGMLCSKDGMVLVVGVNGDVEIPPGVTRIGNCAFEGYAGLTSVTIPRGVVSIGNSAFSHCRGLTSVAVPSGVSSIGCEAFSWNANLRQIDIPDSVRKIGHHAFIVCPKLTVIDIRGEAVEVDKTAFGRYTPVGAKMPDLSKPIGPIHVVVGKDASDEKCPQQTTESKKKELGRRSVARPLPNRSDRASDLVLSTNDLIRCDDKRFVTVAVPVDNVRAGGVTNVVSTLLGTNGSVRVLKDVNAILLTGEAKNLMGVCEAVRICDNSANKSVERSWRLKHAKAEDAKRILDRFAEGFKPVSFRQVPPCHDPSVKCLTVARTEDVARGILTVKADNKENWLMVRMVGSASAAQWDLIDVLVKAIDSPSQDVVERKFTLRRQNSDSVVSAMNALLGEGVACAAASETNAVIAHVRADSREQSEVVVEVADLRLHEWDVTLEVRRIPGVKTLQEARRMVSEKDAEGEVLCRATSCVMNGRTGVLTGRLDKDDPDMEFKMTVEPRLAGDEDLSLRWEIRGCKQAEDSFQMSGATVLCRDQAKVIGGIMRAESRGFFGLGASGEIDTAYLLEITVSENAY